MSEGLRAELEMLQRALHAVREQISALSPRSPKDRAAHQVEAHRALWLWAELVARRQRELVAVLEQEAELHRQSAQSRRADG